MALLSLAANKEMTMLTVPSDLTRAYTVVMSTLNRWFNGS